MTPQNNEAARLTTKISAPPSRPLERTHMHKNITSRRRAPHVAFRVWNVHPSGLVEVLTPRGVS